MFRLLSYHGSTESHPSASIFSISPTNHLFGEGDIPECHTSTPHRFCLALKIVHVKTLTSQVSGYGQSGGSQTITVTFPRVSGVVFANQLHFHIKIGHKAFQLTDFYSLPFRIQYTMPWHCFSCGQTRPQIAGLLFSLMIAMAFPILPFDNSWMNSGIWFSIGHPFLKDSYNSKRFASAMASCSV